MTVTTTDHILLRRTVRLTARASGLLFAGALATRAARPGRDKTAQQLYIAFAATHLVHFAVVARYAMATGGRNLFPGGRHLDDVGGWPTVLTIYALFGGLVVTGREAVGSAGAVERCRSATPPSAPVGWESRTVNTPLTHMCLMPVAY